jgi:hypothetical protein
MAQQETSERKQSRAPKDEPPETERDAARGGDEPAVDEQELASYLQERIKPGLNRGAIPLLARSIAREIARDDYHSDEEDEEEDGDAEAADLEADLHSLQQQLGDDWTLLYAVNGGDAWLAAENQEVTQRIEAPNAEVLVKVVELLKTSGGRSAARRSGSDADSG